MHPPASNQSIFLPYGQNKEDRLVHISEVKSGQSNLLCPYCKVSLIAKKGKRINHHFAHVESSCKTVANGDLNALKLDIPFYHDFFSTELSPNERRAIQVLYQKFGTELFHRKGIQDSAFHVLFQFSISQISRVWESLLNSGHIKQRGNWFHLTKLAEAGMTLLSLSEFADLQAQRLQFFEIFLESGTDEEDILKRKVYENLKKRLLYANLYCLHIPGKKKNNDVWKIGITRRSAKQRLQELGAVIKHQFGEERAKEAYVALELAGFGRMETYIKKRFSASQFPFSYKMQYFTEFFTDNKILEEMKALK